MRLCVLALAVFSALLTGCFFDHPLTNGPTKDLNAWLLGVWECKDAKGKTYRAAFLPLTGDRYTVWVRELGKRPKDTKEWQFEAWISRVGSSNFLTFRCVRSGGQIPEGTYVFAHYTVISQNDVAIRQLQLDSTPDTSSFELRKEVRRKLKDKTLYPDLPVSWTRISEVYWQEGGNPISQPPIPLRYPNTGTREKPLTETSPL